MKEETARERRNRLARERRANKKTGSNPLGISEPVDDDTTDEIEKDWDPSADIVSETAKAPWVKIKKSSTGAYRLLCDRCGRSYTAPDKEDRISHAWEVLWNFHWLHKGC